MNGNDIVDLKTARIPRGLKGDRYLDKVFSREEREVVNSGWVGVWPVWAMKEAVYKAHHRRFNLPRSFNPKGINVHILEASKKFMLAEGEYLGYKYWGRGSLTLDYVHFTATCFPQEQLFSGVYDISSGEIRTHLMEAIALKFDLQLKDLEFVKDKNSIPQILYKKSGFNLPFSISHHGNFSAFSFQLMNY